MVHRLRCFMSGYVRVMLVGDEIFRLFNLCKSHAVILRNITQKEKVLCCDILLADWGKLLPLLKKTHTRVKVQKKVGVPVLIEKMKKRIAFFFCLFGCLLLLNRMDSYVWAIEYIGNQQISNDELGDFVTCENIHYGMKKEALHMEELEKRLRSHFPVVTWTSIYLEGTKLCIEVKENDVTVYEKEERKEGSNLVATEAGTITSMVTRNGVPKVKIGDWVEEGQVLVEGLVPVYDESLLVVDYQVYDADADIKINTLIPYSDTVRKRYTETKYTGRVQNCFFVEFAGKRYEIPGFMKNFERYEKISQKWQCSILENIYLPLFYGEICYKEYQLYDQEYTQNTMKSMLYDKFQHFMETLEGKGVQIIEKNVKISNYTDCMNLEGELLVNKLTGTRGAIDSGILESVVNEDEEMIEDVPEAQEE